MKYQNTPFLRILMLVTVFGGAVAVWWTCQPEKAVWKTGTSPKGDAPLLSQSGSAHAPQQPVNALGSIPSWAVPFGHEFWKGSLQTATPGAGAKTVLPRTVNIAGVIDRVSHALVTDKKTGHPSLHAETFSAVFDTKGFSLSPYRPVEAGIQQQAPSPPSFPLSSPAQAKGPSLEQDPDAVLSLRTVAFRAQAGDAIDFIEKPEWLVVGNTAQSLRSAQAGIVEHYEARGEGVAITWVLQHRPVDRGSLQIESQVQGLAYATSSEQGHHFADAAGVARARIGKVTAVDSAGKRWDLPMSVIKDRLQLDLPETLLAAANYPLAIDPLISPEFGVDQPIAFPVAGGAHALASNGKDYLLVWSLGVNPFSEDNYFQQIRAARIARDGSILNPSGTLLASGPRTLSNPSVASDGRDFFVSWADSRDWDGGPSFYLSIYGGRVSAAGLALDPEGILLSRSPSIASYGNSVAGNSNGYLVVWEDLRNRGTNTTGISDIYGTRVSPAGTVLDPQGIPVSTAPENQTAPAAAATQDGFLVAWTDSRGKIYDPYIRTDYTAIYGATIGNDGVVQQPNGFLINDGPWNQYYPTVASDGLNYFVAWQDERNASGPPWPGNTDIFAARVTSSGAVLDPNAIALTTEPGTQSRPAAAFDGSHWFVVWEDGRNAINSVSKWHLYAARIAQDGVIASPSNWLVATNTSNVPRPAVAANGTDLLMAWSADREIFRPFATGIMGARIRAGAVLDTEPRVLSNQGSSGNLPSVAWNGSVYLLTWIISQQALYDNSTDIIGARVTPSGTILDPSGIAISRLTDVEQLFPVVAANGQDFFVAWQDGRNGARDIFGTLITGAGVVVSSNGLAICTAPYNQYTPLVAASGDQFLVTWNDYRNGAGANVEGDIFGSRISSAGAVLDPNGIPLVTATNHQFLAGVAGNGSEWLLVWTDWRLVTNYPFPIQLRAGRVSAQGQVLDPDGFLLDPAPGDYQSLAVAAHGSEFLVAWALDDNSDAMVPAPILGTRVTGSGVVLNPGGTILGQACCEPINIGVNDTADGYLVSWEVVPQELYEDLDEDGPWPHDLLGVRVLSDGTVRDALPLKLASMPDLSPAKIAGAGQEFIIVYSVPAPILRRQVMAARLSLGLPTPWSESSIVQNSQQGSAIFSPGGISVSGVGTGIGGRSDSFYLLHQPLQGDGQVVARLDGWFKPNATALAGVMLRNDLSDSSRQVFLGLDTTGNVTVQRRKTPNGRSWKLAMPGTIPKYLRLARQGDTISAWTSQNGDTWAFVWVARVHMTGNIVAGLAVAAGQTNESAGVLFSQANVGPLPSGDLATPFAGMPLGVRLAGVGPGIPITADSGAQLLVTGSPGTLAVLDASSDLNTWTELTRFTLDTMPQDFEEDLQPLRFYRARAVSP